MLFQLKQIHVLGFIAVHGAQVTRYNFFKNFGPLYEKPVYWLAAFCPDTNANWYPYVSIAFDIKSFPAILKRGKKLGLL